MDLVETLLELYQQAKTSSERWMLLETVRISNPSESAKLEERILQEHVRTLTHAELVQAVAAHRHLTPAAAETLLREVVLKHLLDRPRLRKMLVSPAESSSAPATPGEPPSAAGTQTETKMQVVIVEEPSVDDKTSDPAPGQGRLPDKVSPSGTPLPRLAPRGMAG